MCVASALDPVGDLAMLISVITLCFALVICTGIMLTIRIGIPISLLVVGELCTAVYCVVHNEKKSSEIQAAQSTLVF